MIIRRIWLHKSGFCIIIIKNKTLSIGCEMKKYIPNIITAFRLLLVPVLIIVFFNCDIRLAFGVFLLASVSDLVDGYLARKWQVVSDFGKLFDPLADKAMQVSAVICLAIKGYVPVIPVVIVFLKELVMLLGGVLLLKTRNFVVYSNVFGKLASFFFSFVVCLCFFRDFWFVTALASNILDVLVWISVVLNIIAMLQYAYKNALKPLLIEKKSKNIVGNEKEE